MIAQLEPKMEKSLSPSATSKTTSISLSTALMLMTGFVLVMWCGMVATGTLGPDESRPRISIYHDLKTTIDSIVGRNNEDCDNTGNTIISDHGDEGKEVTVKIVTKKNDEEEEKPSMDVVFDTVAVVQAANPDQNTNISNMGMKATFINSSTSQPPVHVSVFWVNPLTREETQVITNLPPRASETIDVVHRGHEFVAYAGTSSTNADMGSIQETFTVPSYEDEPEMTTVEFSILKELVVFKAEKEHKAQTPALVTEADVATATATATANFINESSHHVQVYWYNTEMNGRKSMIVLDIPPGDIVPIKTSHDHHFIVATTSVEGAHGEQGEEMHLADFIVSVSDVDDIDVETDQDIDVPVAPADTAVTAAANFINESSHHVQVYWYNTEMNGRKSMIVLDIPPGDIVPIKTSHDHHFIVVTTSVEGAHGEQGEEMHLADFIVSVSDGESEDFIIDDIDDS